MKKEGFKYIEYYFQEIPLFVQNNELAYLTFPEFYIIFNCNIFSYFRKLAQIICDNCFDFQKKGAATSPHSNPREQLIKKNEFKRIYEKKIN